MSASIPESTLCAGLNRVVEQLGRAPPVMESIKLGTHAHQTIPSTDIPARDLWADLERVVDEVGGTPTGDEYDQHGTYSSTTIARRLGDGLWATAIDRLEDDAETRPTS